MFGTTAWRVITAVQKVCLMTFILNLVMAFRQLDTLFSSSSCTLAVCMCFFFLLFFFPEISVRGTAQVSRGELWPHLHDLHRSATAFQHSNLHATQPIMTFHPYPLALTLKQPSYGIASSEIFFFVVQVTQFCTQPSLLFFFVKWNNPVYFVTHLLLACIILYALKNCIKINNYTYKDELSASETSIII